MIWAPALALFLAADPWGIESLRGLPLEKEVLAREAVDGVSVEEIYFTSEKIAGRPVRVYGFLACADRTGAKLPGVLQLHGGGGTASRAGAAGLARRAQACALSIDWSANPKRGARVTDASALGDAKLFGDPRYVAEDLADFSARHVARALARSIDLLESDPRVDRDRIGVSGGSWGGFLALLIAGLDPGVKSVVSGFGAGGFADTWSYCSRVMFQQGPERSQFWLNTVDPILRAGRIQGPVALVTATNELHFWLNTAAETFRRLPGGSRLIISPNTAHAMDHGVRWPTHEWLERSFGPDQAWPDVTGFQFDGRRARWKGESETGLRRSDLYVSPGREKWPGRVWLRIPGVFQDGEYVAELPEWLRNTESDAFPLITDSRDRSASAPPIHARGRSLVEASASRPAPGLVDDFSTGAQLWRLLFENRAKATLEAHARTLVVTEARGQKAEISVETNAVALASSRMNSRGVLRFEVKAGSDRTELRVELFENTGLRSERVFRVARWIRSGDWQPVRVPLRDFETGGETPTWNEVDKLSLAWTSGPRQSWSFRRVRIE